MSTVLVFKYKSPLILTCTFGQYIGTVRVTRKGLPKAVVAKNVKLKKGECVFRRKGNILCLKWCDKRQVSLISTIHSAVEMQVKTNFMGQPVIKPHLIHDYNLKMGGVDHSDNFLSHYQTLKSIKWYRKLLLHLINMATLNAYILNRKYGRQKLSHSGYREYIANYLITTSVGTATCLKKRESCDIDNTQLRLSGKHFPLKLPPVAGSKRKAPARKCSVCNFTKQQLARYNKTDLKLCVKYSSYGCTVCSNVTLCITPCFEIFHTELNYRQVALDNRLDGLL